ncbi:hypothetical protein MYAM1_003670 [Malassezia yamatoensis]|uniref:AB hydrolase-1 domain-containing protein n=1 Tax=Malassezia yamatoensis TaxID=253288 RepID=A0AAJ5YX71_9BASI|nr:hypothetical protein MYAM1_003670 [Malassezia yamatoensis]
MSEVLTLDDGAKIAYRTYGSNTTHFPLVMINGLSAIMQDWDELAQAFAETRKAVVMLDHRGIGESYLAEDQDYTIMMMANDVLSLLRHLNLTRVQLLGFSMGGLVTQAILTHPRAKATGKNFIEIDGLQIYGAVLAATFTKLPRSEFRPDKLSTPQGVSREERDRIITRTMLEFQYDKSVVGKGGILDAKMQRRIEESLHSRRPQIVITQQAGAISQYDSREALKSLPKHLPVLLIQGKRDRMVNYEESQTIQECIPGAQRYIPPQGEEYGHMWFDYYDLHRSWVVPICEFLDQPAIPSPASRI